MIKQATAGEAPEDKITNHRAAFRRCRSHRPDGQEPHHRRRKDGSFRVRWVQGGHGAVSDLLAHHFKAYMREMEQTHRRTAWARRFRLKRRRFTARGKGDVTQSHMRSLGGLAQGRGLNR